eukprot:c13103_g1_i1 orf=1-1005(+)
MEVVLFRHRFRMETSEAQRKFMEDYKLPYKPISPAEFEMVKDKLGQVARSLNQPLPNADSLYYKVPFEEVSELVAGRKVFLQKGQAYVPTSQLSSLVIGQFRTRLSKALVLTNRKWMATIAEREKDRLTPIVETLRMRYLGPDYSQLREEHHLKYGGRQQLGLFLKGVGLKLDDAIAFWRSEFSQKVGMERFDKEYAYNVRHNYGKEGKRADYTPYSCAKIILSTPGVGDHHGCPYRHFSEENLKAALTTLHVNARTIDEVMDKVRNHHYQLACGITFEALHGCPCDTGINHPNQYYEQSQKVLQAKGNVSAHGSPPMTLVNANRPARGSLTSP